MMALGYYLILFKNLLFNIIITHSQDNIIWKNSLLRCINTICKHITRPLHKLISGNIHKSDLDFPYGALANIKRITFLIKNNKSKYSYKILLNDLK
jgi:hypothetical protein